MPRIRGVLACLCAGAVGLVAAPAAPGAVRDSSRPTSYAGGALAQPLPAPVAFAAARLTSHGTAVAPPGAPARVKAIIAAGNRIAHKPYVYGGGHGSFSAAGYDCSGSVSYALHAAGLLRTPLASYDLEGWGRSGRGRWVTIYANGGHVYMRVAGLRFDTSGRSRSGSRWQTSAATTAGYVVRHVPGL
jgi:cell wall-associated NlpC family hydrolase